MIANKISVIIPFFNRNDIIKETIQSILNQTYQNFEILIIDDGSEIALTQKDIQNDLRIKVFRQTNQGQTVARNLGAQKSEGEFLLFLDDDDLISPTYIEKCIHVLQSNDDIKIAYTEASIFGRGKSKKWRLAKFNLHQFLLENCIYVSAVHRKSDFINVGGFDDRLTFFEDWDLWLSIIKNNGLVYRVPETLFHYRKDINQNSVSDIGNKDIMIRDRNFQILYNKHKELYLANNLSFYQAFQNSSYKEKYYNQWFKKLFYFIKYLKKK